MRHTDISGFSQHYISDFGQGRQRDTLLSLARKGYWPRSTCAEIAEDETALGRQSDPGSGMIAESLRMLPAQRPRGHPIRDILDRRDAARPDGMDLPHGHSPLLARERPTTIGTAELHPPAAAHPLNSP
jgi:hypothetical protein